MLNADWFLLSKLCLKHIISSPLCVNITNHYNTTRPEKKRGLKFKPYLKWPNKSIGAKAVINNNVSSHSLTNLCTLILKQPLMSIMDQIDPPSPWQTANIFVLFNAFETLCIPQCMIDMSQEYFSSANVWKSCKYIHFAVRSGLMRVDEGCCGMRAKQMERNNSESNMHFMIAVTVKGLL